MLRRVGTPALIRCLALATTASACSSSTAEPDDPDLQPRIDAYCAKHCDMNLRCSEPPDVSAADCVSTCRTEIPWRSGTDDCVALRWDYYDCRAEVDSCQIWAVGYGNGDDCDAAYEEQLVACVDVSGQ